MAEQPAPDNQKQGMFGSLFGGNAPPQSGGDKSKSSLGGLFGQSKPSQDNSKELANLAGLVNDVSRRLIVLEERYNDVRRRLQVGEQNLVSDFKKIHTEVKASNSEILDTKKEMDEIKGKMLLIIKELKLTAKKEDTDVIQKYLALWEPINFVTQNEVEKMVRDVIEQKFQDVNIKLEQEQFVEQQVKKVVAATMKKN